MLRHVGRVWRLLFAISAAVLLSGCAIFEPHVGLSGNLPTNATYAQVKTEARSIQKKYDGRLADLEYFDLGTGAIQFGAAVAAAGFGVFGSDSTPILASGLAGATAVGIRSFLPFQERKEIYILGSSAIDCAIAVTTLGSLDDNTGKVSDLDSKSNQLAGEFAVLSSGIAPPGESSLRATLLSFDRDQPDNVLLSTSISLASAQGFRLMHAVEAAEKAKTNATNTFVDVVINRRAARLELALGAIVNAVKAQIALARLDPNAAINAAKSHLSAVVEEIEKEAEETKDKAEAGKEEANQTKEEAAKTKATGEAVEKVAKEAGDINGASDAREVVTKAEKLLSDTENAENLLDDIKKHADEILSVTKVSKACLSGLI